MKTKFIYLKNKFCTLSPWQLSLLLNVFFLLAYYISGTMKYEVSDDFIMQLMVSGAYTGEPSPYIMFMNPIIGVFLSSLYQLIPIINWYFYFHISLIFISLTLITHEILLLNHKRFSAFLAITFLCFFSNDLYQLIQFTKTSALLIACGEFLLLRSIYIDKVNYKKILLGITLMVLGAMIRKQCYFIVVAFMLVNVFFLALQSYKSNHIRQNMKKIIGIIVLVCIGYLVPVSNNFVFTQFHTEYAIYKEYNLLRANITDYKMVDYEKMKTDLSSIGISETDYLNFVHMGVGDVAYYNIDIVRQMSDVLDRYRIEEYKDASELIDQFLDQKYYKYISVLGVTLIILLLLVKVKKILIPMVLQVGACLSLLLYLMIQGRIVYRVEYAVFLSLAINIIYLAFVYEKRKCDIFEKYSYLGILALLILHIPSIIPNYNGNFSAMFHSWENHISKYRASFQSHIQEDLLNEISSHPNNIYILGFQSTIQNLYLNYDPRLTISPNIYQNSNYLAGVDMYHPIRNEWFRMHELDETMDFLLKDNVYFIEMLNQDEILKFLQEHYMQDIRLELYKEIDGYYIWKLR